jgi:phospholipase C
MVIKTQSWRKHIATLAPTKFFAAGLALSASADTPTTTPIKHVIVIFQENVSFDHYFATYPFALNTTWGEPSFSAMQF